MKNCIVHVANCTHRLVKAAPCASKIGMNIKFNVRFMITPVAATMLSCLRLPFAVNNVPKMYVTEMTLEIDEAYYDSETYTKWYRVNFKAKE